VTSYFAYGSNMSQPVMEAACPGHRLLGLARLPDHRLAFTRRSVRTGSGVADVVADPGGVVWGVLYELGDEGLATLDAKEGAGWAYERREMRVYADDGSPCDAAVYVVIEKSPEAIPPSDEYGLRLVEAARERGLPGDYVEALARVVAGGGSPAP
jgi:cation transport regulator ChaC